MIYVYSVNIYIKCNTPQSTQVNYAIQAHKMEGFPRFFLNFLRLLGKLIGQSNTLPEIVSRNVYRCIDSNGVDITNTKSTPSSSCVTKLCTRLYAIWPDGRMCDVRDVLENQTDDKRLLYDILSSLYAHGCCGECDRNNIVKHCMECPVRMFAVRQYYIVNGTGT